MEICKNSKINIFPLYFWKFPLYFQVWTFQRKMKKENSETLGNAFFIDWNDISLGEIFLQTFLQIGTP